MVFVLEYKGKQLYAKIAAQEREKEEMAENEKEAGPESDDEHKGEDQATVVWNKQESRSKYWVTRSSVRSFASTAHSFAGSALLPLLAGSTLLIRLFAYSLTSELVGK